MIEIKTVEINKYVQQTLNLPKVSTYEENDIDKIKVLYLNKYNIKRETIKYDYSDMALFHNLEECKIKILDITDSLVENINLLQHLRKIQIRHSQIMSKRRITNKLKAISLSYMDEIALDLFENCTDAEILMISNFESINLEKIIRFTNLKCLFITNSKIINSSLLKELTNLQLLNIENTSLDNADVFNTLKNVVIQGVVV